MYFFSFITYKKVAKIVLSEEPKKYQPFGDFAEGLFYMNFLKKEGFLKDLS